MPILSFLLVATLFAAAPAPAQELETPPDVDELEGVVGPGPEELEGYRYLEEDVVRDRLEDVLSQPEFTRLRARPEKDEEADAAGFEWLDRFLDWLASLFGDVEARETSSPTLAFDGRGVTVLLYGMAALILVAALVFLGRAVLSSSREKKLDERARESVAVGPWTAPGELAPAEYWRRAQELAERGDYKRAIRELLLAAMSSLERNGLVRFRKGLTNRDYLRAARGASRSALAVIVGNFEHVYFGRRSATADGYAECRRELEKGFPMETT